MLHNITDQNHLHLHHESMFSNDETNVRLINAQAEGDGRHDDADTAGHKVVLHPGPVGDAGVVVTGDDAASAQQHGQFLTAGAGAGVDDAAAGFSPAEGQQVAQFIVGVAGVEHLQLQVGAGHVAGDDTHAMP